MKRILFTLLTICLLLAFVPSVFADDPGPQPPGFVVVGDDGTTVYYDTTQLKSTGVVTFPPEDGNPGINVTIPGTEITTCVGCLSFNSYTTPEGQAVYIPTAYTQAVIDVTGVNPFDTTPDYAMVNAATYLVNTYTDNLANWNLGDNNLATDKGGGGDVFNLLKLNVALLNNPDDSAYENRFLYGSAVYVFDNDPLPPACSGPHCGVRRPRLKTPFDQGETDNPLSTRAAPTPRPTARGTARPTAFPTPSVIDVVCPLDPSVTQADPASTIRADKIAPNFPVVVGQDPSKTGVTLSASMSVPPVYYSYNVKNEHTETVCEWGGPGYPGDNCEGKGNEWRTAVAIVRTCDRVTEVYVDRLASVTVTANLAQSSIDWINNELAAKYPGAHVYQANWGLFPGLCSGGGIGTESLAVRCDRVPFADPGKYIVTVSGTTTGTKYTAPRAFSLSKETFAVDLVETALTK
jgi:hypothetical protein